MPKKPNIDPEIDIANVRTNLRMAIAYRDTNAKSVSLLAGLSQNALSSFIRGNTSMGYENVIKVCAVLEIPVGLLTIKNAINPARFRLDQIISKTPPDIILRALKDQEDEDGEA